QVFAGASRFAPDVDPIEFLFFGSDHSLIFSGAKLSRTISNSASEARVRMKLLPAGADEARLLREADGLLLPHGLAPPGAHAIDLGLDAAVLVHAAISAPIRDVGDLSRRPWVIVIPGDSRATTSVMRQIM